MTKKITKNEREYIVTRVQEIDAQIGALCKFANNAADKQKEWMGWSDLREYEAKHRTKKK